MPLPPSVLTVERKRKSTPSAGARRAEQRLNADTSDRTGPTAPCACGQPARCAGWRGKTFESVLGPLTLERAYYHCAPCETGFAPRDDALRLQGGRAPLARYVALQNGPLASIMASQDDWAFYSIVTTRRGLVVMACGFENQL